jgi:4-hydroxybutyrate CoA-transferase
MDWLNQYQPKLVSPEKAISIIRDNARVFLTGNCSVPQVLLKALVNYAPQLCNVEIVQVLAMAGSDYVAP